MVQGATKQHSKPLASFSAWLAGFPALSFGLGPKVFSKKTWPQIVGHVSFSGEKAFCLSKLVVAAVAVIIPILVANWGYYDRGSLLKILHSCHDH